MKRFTLFLIAAFMVSAVGLAQNKVSQKPLNSFPFAVNEAKAKPSKSDLLHPNSTTMMQARRGAFAHNQNSWMKNAPKKVAMKDPITGDFDYITDQPDGTFENYSRGGNAYFYYWGYVFSTQVAGGVGSVVFGPDNTVYIKNLITQYNCNSWTKGTIEGNKIKIKFPQKCLSYQGYEYFLEYGKIDWDTYNFTVVNNNTLYLNYDSETGAITTPADSPFADGNAVIAMVAGEDGSWVGYADYNVKLTKMTDKMIEAPEGITTQQYALSGNGYAGSLVQVGFKGNDVYVQGICESLPDTWVKGTISDGKVAFKNGQYVGPDEEAGYHVYLMSAESEQVWDEDNEAWTTQYTFVDSDITFDYDPETKKMTNGSTFIINCGKDDVSPVAGIESGFMVPFTEVAATPAAPENLEISEYDLDYLRAGYGWGYLSFDLPNSDVDGNYILPEKMSYVVYARINGEEKQLSFSHYDHVEIDEDMSEFAYYFTENWDFSYNGSEHSLYYYVIGPEAYGIQSIYRGAGEERRSEITWAYVEGLGSEIQPEAATPAYPDIDPEDKGAEIDYGYYTGEEDVNQTTNNQKPETYDIAIKIDDPSLVGSYIESITFPLMSLKYISNVSAWLSSQLRVENGKNVPDITSKDVVLLGKEEGFIEAKLDKPYIIPGEGVYVGYSFTVKNVANEETNKNPIAITDQPNEGGFYIHTSDGILKWLDLCEDFGGSALIQVKLGGKQIKSNAAISENGDHMYVLTNNPIEVPIKVINHGAEGVRNVKVNYVITGQVYEQRGVQDITLENQLDGFYGKETTTTLTVPAIGEPGNYNLQVDFPEVNGAENEDHQASWIPISILNTVPEHRPVIEEYTGLWCGWCPRGWVALEKLAKLYPDDYIRISYHNGDAMEIMDAYSFPSEVGGFPSAWIDRVADVDPYYGSGNSDFGVAKDLAARAKEFGQATVELATEWSEDGNSININAAVTFPYDLDNSTGKYALEYVLVADGLTDASWGQSNYYSGGAEGGDLAEFNYKDETVYGLTFNDVAVLVSEIGGIEGSIPAAAGANEPVFHSYVFNLADAVSTANASLIQDKSSLRVVALLVDTETGEIYNANQAEVGQASEGAVGINGVDESALSVSSVKTYDASGRLVTTLQKGVNIRVINFSDGSKKVYKVMK